MTVQAVPPYKRYAANGVALTYTIPFLIIEAGDLRISLNGVPVTTGFTLTGVGQPQSSCTFFTPPTGDLLFGRVIPLHRLVDYQNAGDFLAETVNRDFDRIWLALQGLAIDDMRALRVPPEEVEGIRPVPARAIRATKMLAFDAAGEPIVSTRTLAEIEQGPNAAVDAEYWANLARQWASNPVGDDVILGYFSAYHWAQMTMLAATPPRRYAGAGIPMNGDLVLTPAQVGSWVSVISGSVLTLPAIATVPVGSTFVIRNTFSNNLTVNSLGGPVESLNDFQILPAELVEFAANVDGWWLTSRSFIPGVPSVAGDLIGVPVPYPLAIPPAGYVVMAGQSFSASTFPELALVYPNLIIPDVRGYLIRPWDNSRGADPGRALLSFQEDAMQNITGTIGFSNANTAEAVSVATGAFVAQAPISTIQGTPTWYDTNISIAANFDASLMVRTAAENRSKNIAYNFICRTE